MSGARNKPKRPAYEKDDVGKSLGRMSEYQQKKNRRTLWRLIGYFRFHIPTVILVAFMVLALTWIQVYRPTIISGMIDNHLKADNPDVTKFLPIAVLFFGVSLALAVLEFAQTMTLASLGQRIMHRLRTMLFNHIQKLNMQFFDMNSSGSLLTRVNSDIESLSEVFSSLVVTFVKDVILIIFLVVAMINANLELALWSFILIPLIVVITFVYRYAARRNFIKLKTLLSRLNGFLAENIIGMKIVQIFNREEQKKKEFSEINGRYYRLGIIEVTLNSLSNPLLNALSHLAVAFILARFANRVGPDDIPVGELYLFVMYIRQFFNPIAQIAEQYTSIQSAIVSADRVFDIIDNHGALEDHSVGLPLKSFSGRVEFKNVWFAYKDENWVLKDVSFTVLPGQSVAFVGSTGSGKTTIISLLARFYEIQKGEILIDGVDIREYRLPDLRRCIAVVMQDVFLFSGDVAYNIRLNNDEITNTDMLDAVREIGAENFINSLPSGLSSYVAERGMEFSAGQRQLIAFARAVAFKPSVLILDEATSNIDTDTELIIQRAMAGISENRTSMIIAHRLSTIVHCDNIFVLSQGVLIEHGRHEELVSRGGRYAQLYEMSIEQEQK